jgi:uncharacterized RDD family membrane protein YckC
VDAISIYLMFGLILAVLPRNGVFYQIINDMSPLSFSIIILFLYYLPQEALLGRTLGKLLMGTRVIKEDGKRLTFNRALLRTIYRLIPFDPLTFLGARPRGWHDQFSKTFVISAKSSR